MAVLDASRPRGFRLAWRVSSRAMFGGILLIFTSLFTLEIAQGATPGAVTNLTATAGNAQISVSWAAPNPPPSPALIRYEYAIGGGTLPSPTFTSTGTNTSVTLTTGVKNGYQYTVSVRAVNSDGNGAQTQKTVKLNHPAPAGFTATPGDGQVDLSWTALSASTNVFSAYEYSKDDGANWTSIGNTITSVSVTGLTNGITYIFKVRAVNRPSVGITVLGTAARKVVRPLRDAPEAPGTLNVERVDDTAILTWSPPSDAEDGIILRYEYSSDGGSTWKSTGSSSTRYTVTGLKIGETYTFSIRAVYVGAGGNSRYIYISRLSHSSNAVVLSLKRKRSRIFECPVGWTRGSVFGKTKKALIYELKVNADTTNRTSIYQLKSIAIYVHPDENLETLDGWTLKIGTLYNQFGKEFKLTAENSVIDEHDFAHIENPEGTPIPMGTLGYIGQSLPSFDYRLYDAQGIRVDFGISCYKAGGLTFRLWNTKDPRLLRVLPLGKSEAALSVQMQNLKWQTLFFRSEWTAAVMPDLPDAPAAPSQMKGNIVGTWGDLKKQ